MKKLTGTKKFNNKLSTSKSDGNGAVMNNIREEIKVHIIGKLKWRWVGQVRHIYGWKMREKG